MISDSIDNNTPASEAEQPRAKRKPTKRAKATKKARSKTPPSKPKADGANKKAKVIELMKRVKGATLAEITEATQPIDFAATFGASDINFDGYLDFSVLGEFGAKFGSQLWWIYEPATSSFVQNELTRELGELRTNGYQIAPKKHEIIAESLMAGCPSLVTRYRVVDNHLINVHEEIGIQTIENGPLQRNLPAGVPCTVTVSDLVVQELFGHTQGMPPGS
jgi:hypothetical protein